MPSRVVEILMEQGRQQAEAARRSGEIWGGAVQSLGQIPEQMQHQQRQQLYQQQQQLDIRRGQDAESARARALYDEGIVTQLKQNAMTDGPNGSRLLDEGKFMASMQASNISPDLQDKTIAHIKGLNDAVKGWETDRANRVGDVAYQLLENYKLHQDVQRIKHAGLAVMDANQMFKSSDQLQQAFAMPDDQVIPALERIMRAAPNRKEQIKEVPQGGTLVGVMPATGEVRTLATGQAKPKHFELKPVLINGEQVMRPFDPATGKIYDTDATTDISDQAKHIPAGVPTAPEDIKSQAQMLVDGDLLPSQMSKRSGSYNAVIAEANRLHQDQHGKPLSLTKLELDYQGAKRFVGTLNNAQNLRFRQLADSVVNTIDEVRQLGDALQQGGIQKWNAAKRSTIQQVWGNSPQSELANNYVVAVNTLKEEFANLANGGFAPTEATWKLANQQINADFGFKDLNSSLTEVQRLINFRVKAQSDLRPQGLGGTPNQFAPPAAEPAPKTPPPGVTEHAPKVFGGVTFTWNPQTNRYEPPAR